jgi:hypothetical protein
MYRNFYNDVLYILRDLRYLLQQLLQKESNLKNQVTKSKKFKRKKLKNKNKNNLKSAKKVEKSNAKKESNEILEKEVQGVILPGDMYQNTYVGPWQDFQALLKCEFNPQTFGIADITPDSIQQFTVPNIYKSIVNNRHPLQFAFNHDQHCINQLVGGNATAFNYTILPNREGVLHFQGDTPYEVLMNRMFEFCGRKIGENLPLIIVQNVFNNCFNLGNCTVMTLLTPFMTQMPYFSDLFNDYNSLFIKKSEVKQWYQMYFTQTHFFGKKPDDIFKLKRDALKALDATYHNDTIFLGGVKEMANYLSLGHIGVPIARPVICKFINLCYRCIRIFGVIFSLLGTIKECLAHPQPQGFADRLQFIRNNVNYVWNYRPATLEEVIDGVIQEHKKCMDRALQFLNTLLKYAPVRYEPGNNPDPGKYIEIETERYWFAAKNELVAMTYPAVPFPYVTLNQNNWATIKNDTHPMNAAKAWVNVIFSLYFLFNIYPVFIFEGSIAEITDGVNDVRINNRPINDTQQVFGFTYMHSWLFYHYYLTVNQRYEQLSSMPMVLIKLGHGHIEVEM